MRGVVQLSVLLSLSLVGVGAAASARAADATLYYAPAAPPLIGEVAKAFRHADLPHERVCFNSAETRERIATYKLAEPFQAMLTGGLQGDALHAKLCRWKHDEFVYEIAVLRRDGRLVHVYMNAQNGRNVDR